MAERKLVDHKKQWRSVLHLMRSADILLIGFCLIIALLLCIFFMIRRGNGHAVSISQDGMELYRIDLAESGSDQQKQYYLILYYGEQETNIMHFETYPELPVDRSYNLFSIADGTVTMEAADCRDQICVNHKPIMSERESIICLPHKLVVEMRGLKGLQTESERNKTGSWDKNIDEPLDGVVR